MIYRIIIKSSHGPSVFRDSKGMSWSLDMINQYDQLI